MQEINKQLAQELSRKGVEMRWRSRQTTGVSQQEGVKKCECKRIR
jgi:hypothetical protein